jgi:nitrogen regulatory protein PII-like uncharacterized protein
MAIQKTDTMRSPLLQPVIQRDYTKGLTFNTGAPLGAAAQQQKPEVIPEIPGNVTGQGASKSPDFSKPVDGPAPGDDTKSFSFDEDTGKESDLKEGETGPAVTIPTGSARTFANTIGNLVQIYLPRATYSYVKIDIENVRMNVEKGRLRYDWIDVFKEMNKSAEEGLQIPDESIKMWKAALQHYLEYKQYAFANPETEFWVATGVLLTDTGIRTYSIKRQLEDFMRQALAELNPEGYTKPEQKKEPDKTDNDEQRRAA